MQFQGDSRFARGIRKIFENLFVARHFLTILAGFVLFNSLRTNFDACDKFTTGPTLDWKTLLLWQYKKFNINRMFPHFTYDRS